jgi:hypothetical protein
MNSGSPEYEVVKAYIHENLLLLLLLFLFSSPLRFSVGYTCGKGVEGVVRGLEGTHLADTCILTKLE